MHADRDKTKFSVLTQKIRDRVALPRMRENSYSPRPSSIPRTAAISAGETPAWSR